jgi:hypothetical protein
MPINGIYFFLAICSHFSGSSFLLRTGGSIGMVNAVTKVIIVIECEPTNLIWC